MIDRMINEVLAGKDPKAVIDLCEKTFTSNDWEKIKKAADKLEKNKASGGHVKKGGEMIDVVRTSVGNAQVGIEGSGKGYVIVGGVSTDFEFGIEEGEGHKGLKDLTKSDWKHIRKTAEDQYEEYTQEMNPEGNTIELPEENIMTSIGYVNVGILGDEGKAFVSAFGESKDFEF